jgi:predicted component of type VI protein secretion system
MIEPESMPSARPRIIVVAGPARGRELDLASGSGRAPLTIGRGQDNDLVLADLSVSRHHLTISVDEDGIHARDQGSGNGTLVNGEPLAGARVLRDGDELELGRTTLRLVLCGATAIARPLAHVTTAEIAREMQSVPLPAPAAPEPAPIGTTVPIVRTRRPPPRLGRGLALVAAVLALAAAVLAFVRSGGRDAPRPAPAPVVTPLPPPDAPPRP